MTCCWLLSVHSVRALLPSWTCVFFHSSLFFLSLLFAGLLLCNFQHYSIAFSAIGWDSRRAVHAWNAVIRTCFIDFTNRHLSQHHLPHPLRFTVLQEECKQLWVCTAYLMPVLPAYTSCNWSIHQADLAIVYTDLDIFHPVSDPILQSFSCVKNVKASHTRYRALGPELIPVCRQSVPRWLKSSTRRQAAITFRQACSYLTSRRALLPFGWYSFYRPTKAESTWVAIYIPK